MTLMTIILATSLSITNSSARLLEPVQLAQLEAPPPLPPLAPPGEGQAPVVTLEQLRAEIQDLEERKPSLGLPITLMSIGGGVGLPGLLFLTLGGGVAIISLVTLAIAVPLVGIGVWLLFARLGERRLINEEIELREEQIRRLQQPGAPSSPWPPAQVSGPDAPVVVAMF